ncbi:MAG: rhodanese-like domain-containing protein [Bdellovibrionota bacterium]
MRPIPWRKTFTSFIFTCLALALLSACKAKTETRAPRLMTPQETYGMLSNDFAVLIDVRESDELKESGKATPSKWFPSSKIESSENEWKEFVKTLPKDKEIVFHCASGGRAKHYAEKLSKEGFKTAYFEDFDSWKSAGLPITKAK